MMAKVLSKTVSLNKEILAIKIQIAAINAIENNNVFPTAFQSAYLAYNRISVSHGSSSDSITIEFIRHSNAGDTPLYLKCRISQIDEESSRFEIEGDKDIFLYKHKLKDDLSAEVEAAISDENNNIEALETKLNTRLKLLEERLSKARTNEGNINNISCLVIVVVIIGFIIFGIWGIFFNSAPSSSSQSREEEIAEDMEFLDNISTPGTSEHRWYHDEYLPDNDYPED